MKLKALPLLMALSATSVDAALISLNTITPGTETVTLVANGGFEAGTGNTNPSNWTRVGQSLYDTPANASLTGFSNLPLSGKVAYYNTVVGTNQTGQYTQVISGLEPNTSYVFSAYLWNNSVAVFGSSRNMVIDMNDVTGEAQEVLAGDATDAAKGYFAYRTFDTGVTGTSFTIRTFTAPTTYATGGTPIMVWDNVAITKASDFVLPVPEPSAALLGGIGLLALLRRRRN